jgi:hypothetical protein
MKSKVIQSILILLIVIIGSCRNNRLKTSEKELAKEINTQEQKNQEAERIAMERQVPDTLVNISTGFQYKEERSVDPSHPPKIIDFTKEIPAIEFKLGDLTSKIRYLVLQVPDDSLYFLEWPEISITSKSIIVNNNMGIHSFDRDGKFIETICKNTFSVPRDIEPGRPASNFFSKETFIGAWRNHVQTAGNTVFYKYTNYPAETVSLLRFTLENGTQNLQVPQISETGISLTYARGDMIATGKESLSSGTPGLSSTSILAVSDNCYAGITTRLKAFVKNSTLLVTYNLKGDTLCKFKQYEYLKTPITSTVTRTYSNDTWHFGSTTTIKPAFNDTVFRLIPPNRLVPVFVFNFGDKKTTADDWLNVNIPVDDKIRTGQILENQEFLFIEIIYGPSGIKQKAEIVLFDKSKNKLFRLSKNEVPINKTYNFWINSLENNVDGGPGFWPAYITPEGKPASTLRPEDLKKYIQNSDYTSGSDPKKNAFRNFVQSLKGGGREIVIMIAE